MLQAVAGAAWDSSLLQSARGICLLAGLVSAALLWPVLRRLGLGGNAATTAVIVAGLGPIALRLQPSVDPGAVAAVWIGLAAAVGFRVRPGPVGRVVVLTALAAAAVTSLVAAAGLLAAAAHALAGRTPVAASCRRGAAAPALAVPAAVLAAVAAVAVAAPGASGGRAAGAVPLLSLLACSGWPRWSWAGPGSTGRTCAWWSIMVAVWLGCALVPGPARLTALLLAVPALALLGGALLGERRHRPQPAAVHRRRDRRDGGPGQRHGDRAVAERTAAAQLVRTAGALADRGAGADDVVLSAAPLDRAELVAAGVPAGRFATESVPDGAVTVVPADAGCGEVGTPLARMASAAGLAERLRPAAVGPGRRAGRRDRVEAGGQPGGPAAGPGPAAAAGAPGGRPAGGGAGRRAP